MSLKALLLSVVGVAITAVVVATVVQQHGSSSGVLIPNLNLSATPSVKSFLLGETSGGIPVNEYSATESVQGVIMRHDEHNLVSCPQATVNTPIISSALTPAAQTTLFWGYQYSGRENANYTAGKTKLELFDGSFFLSPKQVAAATTIDQQTLYNQINTLTQLNTTGSGKQIYMMSAVDLCFKCGEGLLPATSCPGHGAAGSSSSSSSVNYRQYSCDGTLTCYGPNETFGSVFPNCGSGLAGAAATGTSGGGIGGSGTACEMHGGICRYWVCDSYSSSSSYNSNDGTYGCSNPENVYACCFPGSECACYSYAPGCSNAETCWYAPTHTQIPCVSPQKAVDITNFAFIPQTRTVVLGTTVTWTNNDTVAHTVTGENGTPNSPTIPPGASFSHLFTATGSFTYHCTIHPAMTGTVIVVPASSIDYSHYACPSGYRCLGLNEPLICGYDQNSNPIFPSGGGGPGSCLNGQNECCQEGGQCWPVFCPSSSSSSSSSSSLSQQACTTNADCPDGLACFNNHCGGNSGDCANYEDGCFTGRGFYRCINNQCYQCGDGISCLQGQLCNPTTQECEIPCGTNQEFCSTGYACNDETNSCEEIKDADLAIQRLSSIPETITPNQNLSVTYRVTNNGPDSPASAYIGLSLSVGIMLTSREGCIVWGTNGYRCDITSSTTGAITRTFDFSVVPHIPCTIGLLDRQFIGVGVYRSYFTNDPNEANNSSTDYLSVPCGSSSSQQNTSCPSGYTCMNLNNCPFGTIVDICSSNSHQVCCGYTPSSSSSSSLSSTLCGNGTVDPGEQCDDGNTVDGDACFSNCRWVVPPNTLAGTLLHVVSSILSKTWTGHMESLLAWILS